MPKTKLVRLNPQNKKRGNVLGNVSLMTPLGTFRFAHSKWYEVDVALVPHLQNVYQEQENPDSKPAFTILDSREQAREHVKREKELEEARKRKAFVRRSFGPPQEFDEKVREVDLNEPASDPLPEKDYEDLSPLEDDLGGDTTSGDLGGDGTPIFEDGLEHFTEEELWSKTVKQLKVLADDLGVEYKSNITKSSLIDLIRENSD